MQRVKKSVRLSEQELSDLKEWVKRMGTYIDAAEEVGITSQNLPLIILRGTCKPASLEKIKKVLYGDQQPT